MFITSFVLFTPWLWAKLIRKVDKKHVKLGESALYVSRRTKCVKKNWKNSFSHFSVRLLFEFFFRGVQIAFYLFRGPFSKKLFLKENANKFFQILGQNFSEILQTFSGKVVKTAFYVSRRAFLKNSLCWQKFSSWLFLVLCKISVRFFGKKFRTWFSKLLLKRSEWTFWGAVLFSKKNCNLFRAF